MKDSYLRNKEKILARNAIWRSKNQDKMRSYRKEWERTNPAWYMYHNAKRRAKDLSIPFSICFKDIVIPIVCPVFGTVLDKTNRETSPSLDRVIPSEGYTPENIQVISMRANRLKNDATAEELRAIADYIDQSQLQEMVEPTA